MIIAPLKFLDLQKVAFLSFFLALLTFIALTDPDYYWHLETGEYLLTHHSLPDGDIFSYTRPGQHWELQEWLFEVILFKTFAWWGESGAKLLTAFLATLSLILSYATSNRILRKPYAALLLTFAYFIPVASGISPRPQLVTYILVAFFLQTLLMFKYLRSRRALFLLPPLMAIWVNCHAGYMIGIALMILFTGCEWVDYWIRRQADNDLRDRLRLLTLVTMLVVVASSLNPYFVGHWLYPFEVMTMGVSTNFISEWLSPNFHVLEFKAYLALLIGFFLAYIYRSDKPDTTELIVPMFFIVMGFISARHIPLTALVMSPFAAMALQQVFSPELKITSVGVGFQRLYGKWIGGGKQLGNAEYVLNWVLLIVIGLILAVYYLSHQVDEERRINQFLPVKATQFILETGITGRMFNTYHYGGYLISRLYPTQKVFIDGRADMYGDDFMKEYIDISGGGSQWEKTFDKYHIDYVICDREMPLRQLLLERGDFKMVFDEEKTSILVRDIPRFSDIIAKHQLDLPHYHTQSLATK